MDSITMDGIWELSSVIGSKDDTRAQGGITPVTIARVDQTGKAWGYFPGSDTETPINGLVSADVKPGDVVQVDISGNNVNVIGNTTSPAVGEREVLGITEPIKHAVSTAQAAASNALQIAQEAVEIAEDTSNHFWDDSYGAHVTDVEEDEWNAAVADGFSDYDEATKPYRNILVGRLGILLRSCLNNLVSIARSAIAFFDGNGNDASNIVASFGTNGAQIGKLSNAHVTIDADSLDISDGATVLSSFDATGAKVGANSNTATIEFCGGKGAINGVTELDTNVNTLKIASQHLRLSAIRPDEDVYFDEDGKLVETSIPYDSEIAESAWSRTYSEMILSDTLPLADSQKYEYVTSHTVTDTTVDAGTTLDSYGNPRNYAQAEWGGWAQWEGMDAVQSAQPKTSDVRLNLIAEESRCYGDLTLSSRASGVHEQAEYTMNLDGFDISYTDPDAGGEYGVHYGNHDATMSFTTSSSGLNNWIFTGARNMRVDGYTNISDASPATQEYFVKYDNLSDSRVQLEHRGLTIWQNSSRNVHMANGSTDANSTWEYSFESAGIYKRTKSGSTWSSWTKIA